MLFQCWAGVEDRGPTLEKHWVNASCKQGWPFPAFIFVFQRRKFGEMTIKFA